MFCKHGFLAKLCIKFSTLSYLFRSTLTEKSQIAQKFNAFYLLAGMKNKCSICLCLFIRYLSTNIKIFTSIYDGKKIIYLRESDDVYSNSFYLKNLCYEIHKNEAFHKHKYGNSSISYLFMKIICKNFLQTWGSSCLRIGRWLFLWKPFDTNFTNSRLFSCMCPKMSIQIFSRCIPFVRNFTNIRRCFFKLPFSQTSKHMAFHLYVLGDAFLNCFCEQILCCKVHKHEVFHLYALEDDSNQSYEEFYFELLNIF